MYLKKWCEIVEKYSIGFRTHSQSFIHKTNTATLRPLWGVDLRQGYPVHGAHVLGDPWVGGSQELINPPESQGLIREHSSSFTGKRYTGSTKTKTETCSNMFIKPNNLIQVQSNGFFLW